MAEWDLSTVDEQIVAAHMEFNPRTRADADAVQHAFSIDSGIDDLTWNEYQASKLNEEVALQSLGGITIPSSGVRFGNYVAGNLASANDLRLLNRLRETTGKLTVTFKAEVGAMEWNDGRNAGGKGFGSDLPVQLVIQTESEFAPIELNVDQRQYFVSPTPSDHNRVGAANLTTGIFITEFMAANDRTLSDEDGNSSDWIELYNAASEAVDLGGWHLTDDRATPNKWSFPPGTALPRGGFLIVFASGKDRTSLGSPFHANFKLSRQGEYLALLDSGQQVRHEYVFDEQLSDASYGIAFPAMADVPAPSIPLDATNVGFFIEPTPEHFNGSVTVDGFVAETAFSTERGFFETTAPFDLVISTATEEASIYYTLDGSDPAPNGPSSILFDPQQPLRIDRTTVLRAAAFRDAFQPTDIETQTYIFLDDVIRQSPDGELPSEEWPRRNLAGQTFDYGLDPDIVSDPKWGPQLREGLESLSTISIVTDLDNLVDPTKGIYVNAGGQGKAWERPASVELIHPDGTPGFQINAGIRPRGNFSAAGSNPKHAFRLFFRDEYGERWLKYPLFGDEGLDEFRKIDIRTSQNDSWAFQGSNQLTFIHDVFSRDNQKAMGQPYTRSRYHHLYINGVYWGLYQSQERSEANYGASYFGGEADDYDVIKSTGGPQYLTETTDGNFDAWRQLWTELQAGVENDADYMRLQGLNLDGTPNPDYPVLLDVDNLILLFHFDDAHNHL